MSNIKEILFIPVTQETGSLFRPTQISNNSSAKTAIAFLQFEGFLLKDGKVTTGGCTSKLNRHDEFTESESESILSIFAQSSGPKLEILYLPSTGAYRLICKKMPLDIVDYIILKVEYKTENSGTSSALYYERVDETDSVISWFESLDPKYGRQRSPLPPKEYVLRMLAVSKKLVESTFSRLRDLPDPDLSVDSEIHKLIESLELARAISKQTPITGNPAKSPKI